MGTSHCWTFKKAYSKPQWKELCAAATRLAHDLPARDEREAQAVEAFPGDLDAADASKRSKLLLGACGSVRPGFKDGSYDGISSDTGGPCMRFEGSMGPDIEIPNKAGQHWIKTTGAAHGILWTATLRRASHAH